MPKSISDITLKSILVILVVINLVTVHAFTPRQRRLSFIECNGWAAGCMNSYASQKPIRNNGGYRDPGSASNAWTARRKSKYFLTSGGSWSVIGKRFGWPVTREIMSPVPRFSANFYEKLLRKLMIKG